MINEAAAGLVVLEVMRTKLNGNKIELTEDELHAILMEAIDLAAGVAADYPTEVQGRGQGVDCQPRVES
jgi:hypothetical protein